MPLTRAADFYLNDRPYMVWRDGPYKGKSWRRSGEVSVPGFATTRTEQGVENFPEQIEFSEVWDDWSGGYGYAYRSPNTPNTYHWGENIDARFPGQIVHAQQMQLLPGDPTNSADYNAARFMDVRRPISGGVGPIPPIPPGQGAVFVAGQGFHARFTPNAPVSATRSDYDAYGLTSVMNTRPALWGTWIYQGNTDGTGFLQIDSYGAVVEFRADDHASQFKVAGNRLWRAQGPAGRESYLRSIADTDGSAVLVATGWSATIQVGDGLFPIVDMETIGDQLFVGRADGVYAGDQSGTFFNILSDVANTRDADNCRDLTVYSGYLMAQALSGVWAYYPSTTVAFSREVGPVARLSSRAPVNGYVRALKGYGAWLYGGLFTGSQSWILAGREASAGLPFVWHTMQRLPHTSKVNRIHVDSIYRSIISNTPIPQRMWVATDASIPATGTSPVYISGIPQLGGDPLSDLSFSAAYVGSARFDLGAIDRGAPGATKLSRRVEVWGEAFVSGAQYADIYYTLDRGTRTLLGRAQTSPVSYLYFPSTQGSFSLWRQLEISVESFTTSTNFCPVYRSIVVSGAILADVVDVISAQVRVSDSVQDRNGVLMRPGAQMISELRELASPSFGPVRMQDLLGNTSIVKVLPPVEETEVWQDGQLPPEVSAGIRMAVLQYSGGG